MRESFDRLERTVGEVKEHLAGITNEIKHVNEHREKTDERFLKLEGRVDLLDAWRNQQDAKQGLVGWLIGSPLVGWVATAAALAWGFLSGKHP